jgi:hypothetical protein
MMWTHPDPASQWAGILLVFLLIAAMNGYFSLRRKR